MAKKTNKLQRTPADKLIPTGNQIAAPSIMECMTGTFAGRTRVISLIASVERDGKPAVYASHQSGSGYYDLDPNTSLEYDADEDVLRYSSNGVEYIIRAIQEDDILI